jgi:antitoxin VapB
MATAKLFKTGGSQAVRLPKEFRFDGEEVLIHREGERVILEPKPRAVWPEGFFRSIRIDDETFERPPQGELPPVPDFDAP